jgi:hypothetical protein
VTTTQDRAGTAPPRLGDRRHGLRRVLLGLRAQPAVLVAAVGALALSTFAVPLSAGPSAAPSRDLAAVSVQTAAAQRLVAARPEPLLPPRLPLGPAPAQDPPPPPAEVPAAPPPFDSLTVHQPKVRLDGVPSERPHGIHEVLEVEGVSFATSIRIADLALEAPTGPAAIRVAVVDPAGFRVLTPQVTADAVEVWQRITEGDAAFIHDTAHRLELQLGERYPAGDGESLRVGALASNGIPPVADAVVSQETADRLDLVGQRSVLIAVDAGADAAAVGNHLQEVLGAPATIIEDPVPRQAFLTGADARQAFEPFTYIDHGDGMITIDPAWVRRNIAAAEMPIFRGHVVCHRLLIPQLRGALQEVVDRGLDDLIDPSQYGGCWVPRHIDFDPNKPLSMHAWGLAVDFNVSTNQLGRTPQMDQRIVEIFERWGFVWGGYWRRPDGMHFELGALLQSPGG